MAGGCPGSSEGLSPLEVRRIHEEFWRALGVVEARVRAAAAVPVSSYSNCLLSFVSCPFILLTRSLFLFL